MERLFTARHDWALSAYSRFIEQLDGRVQKRLVVGHAGPSAVLFGPTQAGKTTLLLTLLGVPHHLQSQVANVLRGGQDAGKSSTAVPTRYDHSGDDHWEIAIPGRPVERLTEDTARMRLQEVRRATEAGHGFEDALTVRIPEQYFAPTDLQLLSTVYDLPGSRARNRQEQDLVRRIAPSYIARADMVLLVFKADDLGFPTPHHHDMEPLRQWTHIPERHRLVLTHAFEAPEVRDALATPAYSLSDYRRDAVAEMLRKRPDFPDIHGLERLVFPVDLGDTWDSLTRDLPDESNVRRAAIAIREASLRGLCEDIHAAADVETRIRFAARASVVIQRVTADELHELEQESKRVEAAATAARLELPDLRVAETLSQEALDEAGRRAEAVAHLAADPPTVGKVQVIKIDDHDVAKVEKAMARAESEIRKRARKAWTRWMDKMPEAPDAYRHRNYNVDVEVDKILREALNKVRADLDHTRFVWWRLRDVNDPKPKAAYKHLLAGAADAVDHVNRLLARKSKEVSTLAARYEAARVSSSGRALADAGRVVALRQSALLDAERRAGELKAEMQAARDRSAESLRVAGGFDATMRDALQAERDRLLSDLPTQDAEARRWTSLELLSTLRTADRLGIPR